jgi:hypothetical protein
MPETDIKWALVVFLVLLVGMFLRWRGKTPQAKVVSDPLGLLSKDGPGMAAWLSSEIRDWDLPYRTKTFRNETPPHPDLLRACLLQGMIRKLGGKSVSDLPTDRVEQVYFLYLSTLKDAQIANAALSRLDANMQDRARRLRKDMAEAKKNWEKWEAMQEAYARHRATPSPTVPKGDLTTQLQAIGPDPDLWHEMLLDIDFDNDAHLRAVDWIVSQPECDRATIRSLGMQVNVSDYLDTNSAYRPDLRAIVHTMMCHWADGYYKLDELSELNPDDSPKTHEASYRAAEAEILAQGKAAPWPFPLDFFRRSVGRLPRSRFKLSGARGLVASNSDGAGKPPAPGWEGFEAAITP